jgi:hypothetical protein
MFVNGSNFGFSRGINCSINDETTAGDVGVCTGIS